MSDTAAPIETPQLLLDHHLKVSGSSPGSLKPPSVAARFAPMPRWPRR